MKTPVCRHSLLLFLAILLSSCASLPSNISTKKTYSIQNTADTSLGRDSFALREKAQGNSGFILLRTGEDAFSARIALARSAEKGLDAQYYMIHDDLIGRIFADELIKAADRGVKVRILIDDIDLEGRDISIATMTMHPNITIRIFNPFIRSWFRSRSSQFITRFGSVTRRMHNKSFTVDNQATIVGGRNIGNEYFDADPILAFADLDIFAIGAVVPEVSASFDEYWNSGFTYPIELLLETPPTKEAYGTGLKELEQYINSPPVKEYISRLMRSDFSTQAQQNTLPFMLGKAEVLSDHPDKLTGYDSDYTLTLASKFDPFWLNLHTELLVFSPYFVPGREGTETLCNLSKNGVRVRIFTNSLASTDVGVVHAGYIKYRTTMLRAGIELYEMNPLLNEGERREREGKMADPKISLHAKAFVFDRDYAFIGSLNLDPRSVIENTEIGIIVHSPELAESMAEGFDQIVSSQAFRLELVTDNDGIEFITWHGKENGRERTWKTDPHSSFWQRFAIGVIRMFPIESQL